jgi:oligopeptide transport system substrate-binding protein
MARVSFLLLLCFLSFLPLACSPQFHPLTSGRSTDLVLALPDDPATLDWNKATDGNSFEVISNLMVGLTRFDSQQNVVPSQADSWSVSSDGQRFIFHLRESARWSDGKPVTSEDYRDSFLRLLDPQTASPYAYYLFDIVNAQCYDQGHCPPGMVGVRSLSPHRLEIDLSHPMKNFPALLTNSITDPIRLDLIRKNPLHWTEPGYFVGNGVFSLKAWHHDAYLVLNRVHTDPQNPDLVSTITFLIIPEPVTQLTLYEQHRLDIEGIPSFYLKKYVDSPDLRRIPQLSTIYYSLNINRKPFGNVHVRKAFALSVDRVRLERIFLHALPSLGSFIPRGLPGYDPGAGFPFDLSRARRELALGGYPGGKGFPSVTLVFPEGTQSRILASFMQQTFKDSLGVTIKLRSLEWKAFLSGLDSHTPALYQSGWIADYPDAMTFLSLMRTGSGNNRTGWSDPRYDRLLDLAQDQTDGRKKEALYNQAQHMLLREGVVAIPLAQGISNILVPSYIKGYWHNAMGMDSLEFVRKLTKQPSL